MVKGYSYAQLTYNLAFIPDSPLLKAFLEDVKRHHAEPRHHGLEKTDEAFNDSVCRFMNSYGQKYWSPRGFNRSHLLPDCPYTHLKYADEADPKLKKLLGDLLDYVARNSNRTIALREARQKAKANRSEDTVRGSSQQRHEAEPNLPQHITEAELHLLSLPWNMRLRSWKPDYNETDEASDNNSADYSEEEGEEEDEEELDEEEQEDEDEEDEEDEVEEETDDDIPWMSLATHRQRERGRRIPISAQLAPLTEEQGHQIPKKRGRPPETDDDVVTFSRPRRQDPSKKRPVQASKTIQIDLVSSESESERVIKKEGFKAEEHAKSQPNTPLPPKVPDLLKAIAENVVLRVFAGSQKAKGGTRVKLSRCLDFNSFFVVLVSECEIGQLAARVSDFTVTYPWDASSSLRMGKGNADDWEEFCGDLVRAFETPDAFGNGKCYVNVDINV
ncbi:MAG: hypothetical protein M1835_005713 [Candelina submexicana]|nr:MAG: hypothetical protein M1835_005713 [Candelina submexicana]